MDWAAIWTTIKDFFSNNVWNIVKFFAILIIGIIVLKLLFVGLRKLFARSKMEPVAQHFLLAILRFLLWLVLVLILLSVIGVQITGIVTALSAAILAIGMALQDNISNVANGIVIVANKLFKKGDFIQVGDVSGRIIEINFLFTTLYTADNKRVTLPNSTIVNNPVVNSGANPKRRVDFTFPVAYESDTELVKKTVIDVMKSNGKIYLDPEPFCKLKEFADSSINFFANCWCDSEDYWDVYYYVMEKVFNEFKRNGISIPFAQVEVRERKDETAMPYDKTPLPERQEKERPAEKTFADEIKKHYESAKEKIKRKKSEKGAEKEEALPLEENAEKKD
ncbi:MAG: mechanosensitive ion channel family protein [Clostridia bacterium]|nr:mechanosensitive ion channel family protein [Clostridia bacterium]